MKMITFYGASDDLIEVEGDVPGCDEYNAEDETFDVAGLRVRVYLADAGVWGIDVSQVTEDVPVTVEKFSMSVEGYSMHLNLGVPDGSYVTRVAP